MTVGRPTHCTGTNSWTPGPPTPKTKSGVRTPNPPVVRPMCVLLMSAQSCSMRPLSMFKRGCSCTSACLVVDNNLTTIAAISIAIKRMQLNKNSQCNCVATVRRTHNSQTSFPYSIVPHFPPLHILVPHFPVLRFWPTRIFRSRIFSRPSSSWVRQVKTVRKYAC